MSDLKKLYGEDTASLAARVTANRTLLVASTQKVADLLEAYTKVGVDDSAGALIALRKQAEIHNIIFESIRNLSGQDIQTFEQIGKYLLENPEMLFDGKTPAEKVLGL
jgi:hypothetical protein